MTWDGALPHDWYGLGGLLIVGLVAIIIAQGVGGGMILKWHRANNRAAVIDREAAAETRAEIHQNAAAIKAQVVNGHTQPLRADLDRLTDDVAELKTAVREMMDRFTRWSPTVSALADDMRGLRADIAEERNSRRDLAADVRTDIAELRQSRRDEAG